MRRQRRILHRATATISTAALAATLVVLVETGSQPIASDAPSPTVAAPALRPAAWTASSARVRGWRTVYSSGGDKVTDRLSYQATALVRGTGKHTRARLQIRHIKGGHVLRRVSTRIRVGRGQWHRVGLTMLPRGDGGRVELRVRSAARSSGRVLVKGVQVTATGRTTRGAIPDRSAAASTSTACANSKLGIPAAGKAFAGQTASGSVTLGSREKYYGHSVAIHRTYWSSSQSASAAKSAAADVAAKRLPWMSFKLPGTWKQVSAGKYDAWAKDLVKRLNAVKGPVWLAFNHEPESSRSTQNVADWVKVQKRLLKLVQSGSDNVATTIILMGYWQVNGTDPALKLDKLWPGNGLVDVLGLDPYDYYGQKSGGKVVKTQTDFAKYYSTFSSFAKAHGARWGVAETGLRNDAFSNKPSWLMDNWNRMRQYGGIAMSYFDSDLHPKGNDWRLEPTAKRAAWAKVLKQSTKIC